MALTPQLSRLCTRMADELNTRAQWDAPGLARAWASFGVEKKQIEIHCAHNVQRVVRLRKGHLRVFFSAPLPHPHYCWYAVAHSPRKAAPRHGWFGWFPVFQSPSILVVTATNQTTDTIDLMCTTLKGPASACHDINLVVYA